MMRCAPLGSGIRLKSPRPRARITLVQTPARHPHSSSRPMRDPRVSEPPIPPASAVEAAASRSCCCHVPRTRSPPSGRPPVPSPVAATGLAGVCHCWRRSASDTRPGRGGTPGSVTPRARLPARRAWPPSPGRGARAGRCRGRRGWPGPGGGSRGRSAGSTTAPGERAVLLEQLQRGHGDRDGAAAVSGVAAVRRLPASGPRVGKRLARHGRRQRRGRERRGRRRRRSRCRPRSAAAAGRDDESHELVTCSSTLRAAAMYCPPLAGGAQRPAAR